jgi:hypothetical protein
MTANELDQKLAALRAGIERARRDQAQAEARRQQAQGALSQVQQAMAGEFPELAEHDPEGGVVAPQDLLARLTEEAAAEVSRVEAALAVAEGTA